MSIKTTESGGLDSETTNKIAMDVMLGVSPEDSDLAYGPEEMAWRKGTEEWQAKMAAEQPDAMVDLRAP